MGSLFLTGYTLGRLETVISLTSGQHGYTGVNKRLLLTVRNVNIYSRRSTGINEAVYGWNLDGIEEVVGSNPIGSTNFRRSGPETWVRSCEETPLNFRLAK